MVSRAQLLLWPDPFLKRISTPVDFEIDDLAGISSDMIDVMDDNGGVGLSAVQIGISIRLIVTKFTKRMVMCNPVIVGYNIEKHLVSEGCLSLPGFFEKVKRHTGIQVEYATTNGQLVTETFTGQAAQCIQHEIDHLNGIFFTDSLPTAKRSQIRGQVQKLKKQGKYGK